MTDSVGTLPFEDSPVPPPDQRHFSHRMVSRSMNDTPATLALVSHMGTNNEIARGQHLNGRSAHHNQIRGWPRFKIVGGAQFVQPRDFADNVVVHCLTFRSHWPCGCTPPPPRPRHSIRALESLFP